MSLRRRHHRLLRGPGSPRLSPSIRERWQPPLRILLSFQACIIYCSKNTSHIELIKAIADMGWDLPTPVQAEAIPLILGGGDVCISAETGSGKTGAFALPLVQLAFESLKETSVQGPAKTRLMFSLAHF